MDRGAKARRRLITVLSLGSLAPPWHISAERHWMGSGRACFELSMLFLWKLEFRAGEPQASTKPGPGAPLSFLARCFPLTLSAWGNRSLSL